MRRTPGILSAFLLAAVLGSAVAQSPARPVVPPEYERALDLIHAYRGSGDQLQQAMRLVEGLAGSHPASGYSQTLIAEALSTWELNQAGEPVALRVQIIELADEALRLDPRLAQAHVAKGRALVRASRYDEANAAIDAALAISPELSGALFLRAEVFRRSGKYAEAEAWYRRFIDSTPSKTRKENGYAWMARMYEDASWCCSNAERVGHVAKARGFHERLLEMDPGSAWKAVNFAIFLNSVAGDFHAAERYAQQALDIMEFPMARHHFAAARYLKLWALMADLDGQVLRDTVARVAVTTGVSLDEALAFEPFSPVIIQRLQLLQTYMATAPARTASP